MINCDVVNAFAASDIERKSFGMLSSVSSLAAAVKSRANVLKVAGSLYAINRNMVKFLDEAHDIMSGKKIATASSTNAEPASPERMRATADNLEHVYRTMLYIGEMGRRAQLTNNSLTAGSLKSILRQSEELLDFADWLEAIADPKGVKDVFERAKRERETGEVYDLTHA